MKTLEYSKINFQLNQIMMLGCETSLKLTIKIEWEFCTNLKTKYVQSC